jgi:hypothetical protein
MNKSFCFFFQKEALPCLIDQGLIDPSLIDQASRSFLKKRTKKLSFLILA